MLAVLERQQEAVVGQVDWLEFSGDGSDVQLLEWNLDVCECQLAERRIIAEVVQKRAECEELNVVE